MSCRRSLDRRDVGWRGANARERAVRLHIGMGCINEERCWGGLYRATEMTRAEHEVSVLGKTGIFERVSVGDGNRICGCTLA